MSESRGEMVPLHAVPGEPEFAGDVSFEIALDDMPEPPVPFGEVSADTPDERLPVVPEWMRPEQAKFHLDRMAYSAAVHAMRTPEYLVKTAFWAPVGVLRLTGRLIRWWHVLEQHGLRSQAAAAGDSREWMKLHKEAKETRKVRGIVLGAAVLVAGSGVAWVVAQGYGWWLLTPVGPVWLLAAHHGHPVGKPILRPAQTTPRFRLINLDVILRAYYAAGLGSYDKPDQQVTFPKGAARDGEGSRVLVDLPYGKSLKDAMTVKHSIASGLDVTESQVYLHRDPTSARRHTLWIADRDPLAVPVGRTPLLACKPTDIWKSAPLGLDERGQVVKVPLMWHSLLVGALPRMGKTFAARQLALYCALDPYVRLHVFDASGKPDWRKFSLVAENCGFGLTPTRDGLPPEILLRTLEGLKNEVNDRYTRLSELQETRPDLVPEGKLTRELARNQATMRVNVLVVDEVQEFFDLGKISEQIADLMVFLTKVGPAAGMPVIIATQRPSGIGTGAVATRFLTLRDMCALRFSLRTPDYRVSEMVLGAGASGEGLDSSKLLPEYKGVGILRHASDKSPTVRTYLADGHDTEKILTVARAIRERAGTLAGMALGESTPQQVSILADVLAALGSETAMQWQALARLLAQRFPDRHKDATAETVSALCRAARVPSVDVMRQGRSLMGCRREHIEAAIRKQQP